MLFRLFKRKKFTLVKTKKQRKALIISASLMAIIIPLVAIMARNRESAEAAWWNDQWLYRKSITITYAGSTTLTDFQVELDEVDVDGLNTAGKLNSDCSDLRFVAQNGEELDFWIEDETDASDTFSCSSSDYDIWVKIPRIEENVVIYMYYGNPSATVNMSNGPATFDFFDDFNDQSIDTVLWTTEDSPDENSEGNLVLLATFDGYQLEGIVSNQLITPANPTNNSVAVLTLRAKQQSTALDQGAFAFSNTQSLLSGIAVDDAASFLLDATTGGNFETITRNEGSGSAGTVGVSEDTNFHQFDIILDSTASTTFSIDGTSSSITSNNPNEAMYIRLQNTANLAGLVIDHVYARKLASTSPTIPAYGSYGTEEESPGPVAYWKFDEGADDTCLGGTNDVCDSSSNTSNDGAFGSGSNAPTWANSGLCLSGNCIRLDGTGDDVTVTDNSSIDFGTGDFSLSGWVKINSTQNSDYPVIVHKGGWGGTTQVGYNIYYDNIAGNLRLRTKYAASGSEVNSLYSLVDNNLLDKWIHIALSVDRSGNQTAYVNGEQVDQDSVSSYSAVDISNSEDLYFGAVGGATQFFNGFIDEFKIHRYAITAEQVKADYTTRSRGANVLGVDNENDNLQDGLLGYWTFDEKSLNSCGTSTDLCDLSGNATNMAALADATMIGSSGVYGTSGDLDGTGDYFCSDPDDDGACESEDLFDFPSGQDFSVSGWLYRDNDTTGGGIVADRAGFLAINAGFSIYVDATFDDLWFEVADGTREFRKTTGTLSANTWYHFVVVYDSDNFSNSTIYINGSENVDYTDGSSVTQGAKTNTAPLYIGAVNAGNNFTGDVDEVRIYNRALTQEEVLQLYNWAPGPVGYWKFDEGSGSSADDISGNAHTGALGTGDSAPSWDIGKFGGGLEFDGSNDLVQVTDTNTIDTASATITAWVYPRNNTNTQRVTAYYTNSGAVKHTVVLQSNGAVAATFGPSGGNITPSTATSFYSKNRWYHVAASYDAESGAGKIYVDGVLHDTDYSTGNLRVINDDDFFIGSNNGSSPLDGILDDVRIYNYARTQQQIIEDMNAGHPAVGTPVGSAVGHWKFDEGALNTCSGGTNDACDSSGQGNDLEISSGGGYTNNGKFGKAFNGDGSVWASIADNSDFDVDSTDDLTISMWVRSDSASNPANNEYLIEKLDASAGYGIYFDTGGDIIFGIDDDATSFPEDSAGNVGSDYYDGTWHHVVAVKNEISSISLYVDKELVETDSSISATGSLANSAALILAAQDTSDGTEEFNGDIDEVKIYRFALTQDQINTEYNRGKSIVLGAVSTDGTGSATATSYSADSSYCPPGDQTGYCAAPIAEWKLDENTGTSAYDTSGNGNTGTLGTGGSSPAWTIGKIGGGLYFDGTYDVVEIANESNFDFASTQFNISGWVYPKAGQNGYIVSKDGTSVADLQYDIFWSNSTSDLYFTLFQSDGNVTYRVRSSAIPADQWTHFSANFDTNTTEDIDVYINGTLDNATVTNNSATRSYNSTGTKPVWLGNRRYFAESPLIGNIDNIRFYDYARSQAQIAWEYNRGKPIGHWKFDECEGTTAYDSSGNGTNLTISAGDTSGSNDSVGTCNSGAGDEMWDNGTNGKRNASLDFDSTNDTLKLSTSNYASSDTQGTVTAWVKVPASPISTNLCILCSADESTTNYYIGFFVTPSLGGVPRVQQRNNDTNDLVEGSTDLRDNTWHHIAYVSNGTTYTIYVDGIQESLNVTAGSNSGDWFGDTINRDNLTIGYLERSSSVSFFDGQIDDVKIYNYALTEQQVKTDYYQGAARFGPSSGSP